MKAVILLQGKKNNIRRLADKMQELVETNNLDGGDESMDYMEEEGYGN